MSNQSRIALISVSVVALALTFLFWWPLYLGAGFIGGDLYPYFFPQKAFYADCLKAGQFPLWNDLAGFGYPVIGESQTGAAYPFHLILYRYLDLNTAYNVEHLLHYLICFIATWLFARRLGLTEAGAGLTALVFTYGWFPPRACLEWAILTGAWMPVALWCVESFLQTRLWRYSIGLSFTIGLQLLAGHYHLAFITELLVASYAAFRLWNEQHSRPINATAELCSPCRKKATLALALAVLAGACLASVQLLPTWELKQRSSRVVKGGDYDPAYGHLPPFYLTQLIAPWYWYSPLEIGEENFVRDIAEFAAPWHWFGPLHDPVVPTQSYDLDQAIQRCRFSVQSIGTNKVEAHFYCGLVPGAMAIFAMFHWLRNWRGPSGGNPNKTVLQLTAGYWLAVGLLALVYATGFLVPIGRYLPGFSFFRGPGRYGIVATLAIALLAGQLLGQLAKHISTRSIRVMLLIVIFGSTCGDLWLVSRMVKYTVMVSPPRISFRDASIVRNRLLSEPMMPRLLAPGPNVGNLLGVSCVPWYLGIAPAEYVDPKFEMPPIPKPLSNHAPTPATPELIEWLSRSGVTHVLNFDPLDENSWHVKLIWKGIDPFLNRVWAREEPIHLYRFQSESSAGDSVHFPGRAFLSDENGHALSTEWKNDLAGSRRIIVESEDNAPATLILTELAYPGWTAQVNSTPLEAKSAGLFRSVEIPEGNGEVKWTYQPHSVYYGAAISIATFFLLASIAHMRFWHPKLVDRIMNRAMVLRRAKPLPLVSEA